MFEWLSSHREILWWLGTGSIVMFVGTLVAGVVAAVRLPRDFLVQEETRAGNAGKGLASWLWRAGEIVLGVVLIAAGVAMLVLPGQGVLTIALGLMLLGLSGGPAMARCVLGRPRVRRSVDRLRGWFGRPPLAVPEEDTGTGQSRDGKNVRGDSQKSRSTTIGR